MSPLISMRAAEMDKAKPRDTVILPLMKSTYRNGRMFIENDAKSVQSKFCSSLKNGQLWYVFFLPISGVTLISLTTHTIVS